MKVLMACSNYWNSPFHVGSHHIAKGLASAGHEIAFVSNPISPLHIFSGDMNSLWDRFSVYKKGGIWDDHHGIWTYVPATITSPHNKPILNSRWVQINWHKLTFPNVVSVLEKNGFPEVDLLYLDTTKTPVSQKTNCSDSGTPGSVHRLNDFLSQIELTYDLYSSTPENILELLPSPEFDLWKS